MCTPQPTHTACRWVEELLARLQRQPQGTHSLFNLGSIVLSAAALGHQLPADLLRMVLADFHKQAQASDHRQVSGQCSGMSLCRQH